MVVAVIVDKEGDRLLHVELRRQTLLRHLEHQLLGPRAPHEKLLFRFCVPVLLVQACLQRHKRLEHRQERGVVLAPQALHLAQNAFSHKPSAGIVLVGGQLSRVCVQTALLGVLFGVGAVVRDHLQHCHQWRVQTSQARGRLGVAVRINQVDLQQTAPFPQVVVFPVECRYAKQRHCSLPSWPLQRKHGLRHNRPLPPIFCGFLLWRLAAWV